MAYALLKIEVLGKVVDSGLQLLFLALELQKGFLVIVIGFFEVN